MTNKSFLPKNAIITVVLSKSVQFWVNPYCIKMLSHPDSTIYTFKINDWIDPPPDDKCYSERVIE